MNFDQQQKGNKIENKRVNFELDIEGIKIPCWKENFSYPEEIQKETQIEGYERIRISQEELEKYFESQGAVITNDARFNNGYYSDEDREKFRKIIKDFDSEIMNNISYDEIMNKILLSFSNGEFPSKTWNHLVGAEISNSNILDPLKNKKYFLDKMNPNIERSSLFDKHKRSQEPFYVLEDKNGKEIFLGEIHKYGNENKCYKIHSSDNSNSVNSFYQSGNYLSLAHTDELESLSFSDDDFNKNNMKMITINRGIDLMSGSIYPARKDRIGSGSLDFPIFGFSNKEACFKEYVENVSKIYNDLPSDLRSKISSENIQSLKKFKENLNPPTHKDTSSGRLAVLPIIKGFEDVLEIRWGHCKYASIPTKDSLNLITLKHIEKEKGNLSFSREDLKKVLDSERYNPEDLIHLIESDFKKDLDVDAGVWEGYSIKRHTLMVMNQFEKYFGDKELPEGVDKSFFRFLLSLHDIGKAEAILAGDKRKQHEFTLKKVKPVFDELGFSEKEWQLFEVIVGHDNIGDYVKGGNINNAISKILEADKKTDLSLDSFMKILETFYKVDAGSYTEDAGGERSLDRLFNFDYKNKNLSFSEELENRFVLLRGKTTKIKENDTLISSINKKEDFKIKEGVDFVFEQNPELTSIGTKEQYSQYLETIFPNSKVDAKIFQHQTQHQFDNFSNEKKSGGRLGNGHYFSDIGNNYLEVEGKSEWVKKAVVLNIKNPKHFLGGDFAKKVYSMIDERGLNVDDEEIRYQIENEYTEQLKKEYDALIGDKNGNLNSETLVFDSSQIHILGSKEDIKKFKEFLS